MNFFIGFILALIVFIPMFVKVWKAEVIDPEEAKTLTGTLD